MQIAVTASQQKYPLKHPLNIISLLPLVLLALAQHSNADTGWQDRDIGTPAAAGSASIASNTITVSGSGADVWYGADAFHYVYQPWSGNGVIIARVESVSNTSPWAKAGVMFRQSLDPASANVFMILAAQNGTGLQSRGVAGAATDFAPGSYQTPPAWIKLVRTNDTFIGYQSLDGKNWSFAGSTNIPMADPLFVGLGVTSHNDGALCTAVFSNVDVSNVLTPAIAPTNLKARFVGPDHVELWWTDNCATERAFEIEILTSYTNYALVGTVPANVTNFTHYITPGYADYWYRVRATQAGGDSPYSNTAEVHADILPSPWLNLDVGDTGQPGQARFYYDQFMLDGWGDNIGGAIDGFQYAYQSWSGDGEIIAQLDTPSSNPQAKAGLMFRQSVGPSAANAFMMVVAQGGSGFQSRAANGATTAFQPSYASAVPQWLRLVRKGQTFSGYQSLDGTNWTFVASQTIAMTDPVLVGMALTACETTSQYGAEAWFTGVAVRPPSSSVASAPLRIRLGGRQPNGAMQIIVQGQAGRMYQVEVSTNLANWAPLTGPSPTDASGNAVVNDDAAGAYRYRFYRAVGR